MTTPNFKVLLHSMRLGQPPDVNSIRALVEQLLAQQEELEEMRRQITLLHNRVAAFSRTADPEAAPQSEHETVPNPAYPPGPGSVRPSAPPPGMHHEAGPPSSHQPPSSHPPPSRRNIPNMMPLEHEEHNSTVVINRNQIGQLEKAGQAPFPIAPPAQTHAHPAAAPDIPGAPWARGGAPAPAGRLPVGQDIHETHVSDEYEAFQSQPMFEGDVNDPPPRVHVDFEQDDDMGTAVEVDRVHRRPKPPLKR